MKTGFQKIAHRGASGYAPENTLVAFSKAIEMGAVAVEFDVRQTRDMKLVVIHDPDLKRVGRAEGRILKCVRDLNYAELSQIDVGSWFAPKFKDQRVPLLTELLDVFEERGPRNLELHLEIKNEAPFYGEIERRILEILSFRGELEKRVVVSSFDHPTLHRIRAADSRIRLGYLAGPIRLPAAIKEAKELSCESINLSLRRISRGRVQAVRAAGLKTLVYTVNTPEDAGRMAEWGVDGIFTNFPDLAIVASKRK